MFFITRNIGFIYLRSCSVLFLITRSVFSELQTFSFDKMEFCNLFPSDIILLRVDSWPGCLIVFFISVVYVCFVNIIILHLGGNYIQSGWFGHVERMDSGVKKCSEMAVEAKRERGRPWDEVVQGEC